MSQFEVNPDLEFSVLLNGRSVSLSLDALAEAYEADTITESTLIWQPGFPEWLPLASVLAELDAPGTAASMAPLMPDTFQVLVAGQESKQMNVHSLRDAVRLGVVPTDARVWQPGFTEWVLVSQLFGADSLAAPVPMEAPVPTGFASARPAMRTGGPSQPAPAGSAPVSTGRPPLRSDGPVPRVGAPSVAPASFGMGGAGDAPVSTGRPALRTGGPSKGPSLVASGPVGAPVFSLPPTEAPPVSSAFASAPQASLAPMAMGSLAASLEDDGFAPPKQNRWPLRGLVLVAAAVAAFALYRNGVGTDVASAQAAAQADTATPHGMNSWLKNVDSKYGLDGAKPDGVAAPSASSPSSSAGNGKLALSRLPQDDPADRAAASTAFGNLLAKKEAEKAAPAPSKSKATASHASAPAPRAKKGKKDSAPGHAHDAYDPMNGTL